MPRLNPAQHRLLERHVERAIEALREADRLLHGQVADLVEGCVAYIEERLGHVDVAEVSTVSFKFGQIPATVVPYLDNPFLQGLLFNAFCDEKNLSHTRAGKLWHGGASAVACRNTVFLPAVFADLWEEGSLDKTRLLAIANRNLTTRAYEELATMVKTRRKEDVDERLLKLPPEYLNVGRRGPDQAMLAAKQHGWLKRFANVEVAENLVHEAMDGVEESPAHEPDEESTAATQAVRSLRAGLNGAALAKEVEEALGKSPDPQVLVERFLTAHRKSGDADPDEVSRTLFFAHAGPMQKLVTDDKFLLRHFRPVKTQKRGQLFYRILEVIEETLLANSHHADLEGRNITEVEATEAVRQVLLDLNQDPNRFLKIDETWLGEVTRRHLYFGSRTRKEGAAYKWFRKMGQQYYLGSHKTRDEIDAKAARKAAKFAAQESE